jgi:hypothetical protein
VNRKHYFRLRGAVYGALIGFTLFLGPAASRDVATNLMILGPGAIVAGTVAMVLFFGFVGYALADITEKQL